MRTTTEHSKKVQRKLDTDRKSVRASHVQTRRVMELSIIDSKIQAITDKQEFLRRCGLDREARRMNDEYNRLVYDRKEKLEQIERERRDCAKHLLMCFVAADLATECAEAFSTCLKGYGYTPGKDENAFTELLDETAKKFNEIVCLIDETGNYEMSALYADMADAVTTIMRDKLAYAIDYFQKETKDGQRYF